MSNGGIYQIRNTRNGKIYIGSTKNFDVRKKEHFNSLKNGKHHSLLLQRGFDREPKVFVFEKIIICSNKMLLFYEQKFFDLLSPKYNISKIAGRIEWTEELRKKQSTKLKETLTNPELLAKRTGKNHWTVRNPDAKYKKVNEMLGKNNVMHRPEVKEKHTGKNHHTNKPENKGRYLGKNNPKARTIIEIDTGKVFNTIIEAANFYNINRRAISAVCSGKRNHHMGYRFVYLKDYKLEAAE